MLLGGEGSFHAEKQNGVQLVKEIPGRIRLGGGHQGDARDLRMVLLKRLRPARLETRTKESNTRASLRVGNP